MRALAPHAPVYLWLGAMDMRVSFDRLALFVKEKFGDTVTGDALYVFFSRGRDRVKILYWDKDGYALWYKRLEAGVFRIERRDEQEEIMGVDLGELLSGIDLARIKLRKSAENGLYS